MINDAMGKQFDFLVRFQLKTIKREYCSLVKEIV